MTFDDLYRPMSEQDRIVGCIEDHSHELAFIPTDEDMRAFADRYCGWYQVPAGRLLTELELHIDMMVGLLQAAYDKARRIEHMEMGGSLKTLPEALVTDLDDREFTVRAHDWQESQR